MSELPELPEQNRIRKDLSVPLKVNFQNPPPTQQLRVGVGVDKGKVVLIFGEPVAQVGLDAKSARLIAVKMIEASELL